jgi:hypothetical protein
MAADGVLLSTKDYEVISRLVLEELSKSQNTTNRAESTVIDREEILTPEFYVAKTPIDGIPASVLPGQGGSGSGSGSGGSGSGSSSGSGSGSGPPVIAAAECDIWRALVHNGTLTITPTGFKQRIHNLSTAAVAGDDWVQTARDKYGTWWAILGGGVGGGVGDRIEVTELHNSGVTPPPGYEDRRIRTWNPVTNNLEIGPSIWFKNVTTDPA